MEKILLAVQKIGNKSMKQCKDKIRNLKELYKTSKDSNKKTGENLHLSPFYNIFDEMLGDRDVVTIPLHTEVGLENKDKEVNCTERLFKVGKKRKRTSTKDCLAEVKVQLQESEERNQTFLRALFTEQQEIESREREKDRKLLLDIAKILKE